MHIFFKIKGVGTIYHIYFYHSGEVLKKNIFEKLAATLAYVNDVLYLYIMQIQKFNSKYILVKIEHSGNSLQ